MTEHNTDSVNATALPKNELYDLAHESCMLASMIEGLAVLESESGISPDAHPHQKRASNGLTALFEVVIERAWALTIAIEKAEAAARK